MRTKNLVLVTENSSLSYLISLYLWASKIRNSTPSFNYFGVCMLMSSLFWYADVFFSHYTQKCDYKLFHYFWHQNVYIQICSSEEWVRNPNYEYSLTTQPMLYPLYLLFFLIATYLPSRGYHHLVMTSLALVLWPELWWEVSAFVLLFLQAYNCDCILRNQMPSFPVLLSMFQEGNLLSFY